MGLRDSAQLVVAVVVGADDGNVCDHVTKQIVEEGLPVQVPEHPRDAAEHHMVEDPFLEYDAEGVRRAETGGAPSSEVAVMRFSFSLVELPPWASWQ